jgi:hypothetical protein
MLEVGGEHDTVLDVLAFEPAVEPGDAAREVQLDEVWREATGVLERQHRPGGCRRRDGDGLSRGRP